MSLIDEYEFKMCVTIATKATVTLLSSIAETSSW